MAPTCYNSMKNLHYRTQSLPESVYQHQMLHLTQPAPDYHAHYPALGFPGHHTAAHIKKRNALRRSQTSVGVSEVAGAGGHHRGPLTAGLYEQFLPPPNFNAIGLPGASSRAAARAAARSQSFYSSGHHSGLGPSQQQVAAHHYRQARLQQQQQSPVYPGYPHPVPHPSICDQPSVSMSVWPQYRGSVPNLPSSAVTVPGYPSKAATSPLFVDCSVEYDLGEQPAIPADSEPLLTIHPDYVAKVRARSQAASKSVPTSPYPRPKQHQHQQSLPDLQTTPAPATEAAARPSCQQSSSGSRLKTSPDTAAKMEAVRKLSCESRDSGIGMATAATSASMSGSLYGPLSGYPVSCDPLPYPQHQHQTQEYMGKLLPGPSKRRAQLTGMTHLRQRHAPAPPTHASAASNHYQNLRIYYQLAF